MTPRDKLIEAMTTAIAQFFGENDDPYDAAVAALSAIEAMGCAVVPVEPTRDMLDSFYADEFRDIYAGLLEASPYARKTE